MQTPLEPTGLVNDLEPRNLDAPRKYRDSSQPLSAGPWPGCSPIYRGICSKFRPEGVLVSPKTSTDWVEKVHQLEPTIRTMAVHSGQGSSHGPTNSQAYTLTVRLTGAYQP
ncbi:hypothetical protein V2G26_006113 [Clonostachys chloroleuca]